MGNNVVAKARGYKCIKLSLRAYLGLPLEHILNMLGTLLGRQNFYNSIYQTDFFDYITMIQLPKILYKLFLLWVMCN